MVACLIELGIPHQTEPRNRYVQTNGRPDITFCDTDSGVTYECAVSLAHPWRKDIGTELQRHADMQRQNGNQKNVTNIQRRSCQMDLALKLLH